MSTAAELESKLWSALRSDRVMMLGLVGKDDGHTRPMTAIIEGEDRGPIWFFTSIDNEIVTAGGGRAVAAFVSKGHDLFATIHGRVSISQDPAAIDRLWNSMVAAWFDGQDDPKLRVLRLDPEGAQIWENASSLFAGVRALFGADPKEDYKSKVLNGLQ
ncbi:pyridoxamine 5'-phosphate oxidase family protein [Paracoccus sp. IB05]|uniref:pyridoxamine 5'-phosphate oxidase family protein n=1 Tax=Paracoccus sp. IB05 TaxID=2779367 RepID=UPI0018E7FFF6|nr:pyridoxamine 5'-phosphate oxidase family protein [Paracoccus sp. IB05]MBJ2149775.1 pyridoxamine 5'-phosphate oxidase family protein [Paracoccus sp. IB05]